MDLRDQSSSTYKAVSLYEYWASFPKAAAKHVDSCLYPDGRNDLNLTIEGNAPNIVKTTDQKNKNMIFTVKNGTITNYLHTNEFKRRPKTIATRLGLISRANLDLEGKKFHLIFNYQEYEKNKKEPKAIYLELKKVLRILKGKPFWEYQWIQTSFVTEDENIPSPLSETSLATADAPCGTQPLTGLEPRELIFVPGFDFFPTFLKIQNPTAFVEGAEADILVPKSTPYDNY